MTAKVKADLKDRQEIRFGSVPEATEADVDEWELGAPTTEDDNTPSVILANMLDTPTPKKELRDISGRERAPTVVDRPRPGGGTLIGVGCEVSKASPPKKPHGKSAKILVTDAEDGTVIPQSWKDYL